MEEERDNSERLLRILVVAVESCMDQNPELCCCLYELVRELVHGLVSHVQNHILPFLKGHLRLHAQLEGLETLVRLPSLGRDFDLDDIISLDNQLAVLTYFL